jgi:hypothetical protein
MPHCEHERQQETTEMRTTYRLMMDPGLARPIEIVASGLALNEARETAKRMQRDRHLYYKRLTVEPEPAFSARETAELMVGAWETAARVAR